jgi:sigma-B regulation protein RsbU (phosphoserine phosphatase)
MDEAAAPMEVSAPHDFHCAEVWGGNHTVYTPVSLPGLRGVLFSQACTGGRGGDLHYLSMCGSGLLSRICLADVVGHGDEVAGVGRDIHALLRRHLNWPDHRTMLRRLNRSVARRGLEALTTAAVLSYYPPRRQLAFSYAGHPPGWYYAAAGGAWRRMTLDQDPAVDRAEGICDCPLAVDPDAAYSRARVRPRLGDRILLVTDGVLEAPDASGRQFGAQRLARLLIEQHRRTPAEISAAVLQALTDHVGTSRFRHDDVSFLLLEFPPPPRGPAIWHAFRNRILRPLGLVTTPAA